MALNASMALTRMANSVTLSVHRMALTVLEQLVVVAMVTHVRMVSTLSPVILAVTAHASMAPIRSLATPAAMANALMALTLSLETPVVKGLVLTISTTSLELSVIVNTSVSANLVAGTAAPRAVASMTNFRKAVPVIQIAHQTAWTKTETRASLTPEDCFMKKPLTSCSTEEYFQHVEETIKLNLSRQVMVG